MKYLFALFLLVSPIFAQEKNSTTWPYGGVPDSSRYEDWMERVPLNFTKAWFSYVIFDSMAHFYRANFDCTASF
ncbi:MAG: hypothetical protein ACE5I1_20315, partial [bacterium]